MDFDIRIQVTANANLDRDLLSAKIIDLIAEMTDNRVWTYEHESKIARETILEVQGTERKLQIIPVLTQREYNLLQKLISNMETDDNEDWKRN